jgi:hypothetical protein
MAQPELDRPIDPRFDREGDWDVLQLFSDADRALPPEEYAARRGHLWLCFSFHRYRYRDPALGAWVKRVGELLFDDDELERWRRRLLTPEERAEIARQQAEEP